MCKWRYIHTYKHTYMSTPTYIHTSIHMLVLAIWDSIRRRYDGMDGEQHPRGMAHRAIVWELWIGRPFLLLLGAAIPSSEDDESGLVSMLPQS